MKEMILKSDKNLFFATKTQAENYAKLQGYKVIEECYTFASCFTEKERCSFDVCKDDDVQAILCEDEGEEILLGFNLD